MSAVWLTLISSELPMPWPAWELMLSRTGWPDAVAAYSRAIILRECMGLTRPSVSPVAMKMAGYFVPLVT